MTTAITVSRTSVLSWVLGVGLAVLLLVGGLYWRAEKRKAGGPVGAYAIPLDDGSRAGGTWRTQALTAPRTFAAGQTLKISRGSKVRVIFPDGRAENLNGPAKIRLTMPALRGETLENFLAVPLAELANLTPEAGTSTAGDVRIVSPVGVTRFTNPVIMWVARPETDYDAGIVDPIDEMAPPRIAKKVRPPLTMEQLTSPQKPRLKPDRLYEVHVRETVNTLAGGAARVLVAKDAAEGAMPDAPADLLSEAVGAMVKRPTRTGDAWLALSRLPEDWKDSELAVRLRLRVSGELGLVAEFALAQEAAWRLVKK